MEKFYVYVHKRVTTGRVFYVGKGHGGRANTHKSRNEHWKNIVSKDGGRDVEIIAKKIDEELAFLVEIEAIDKYRRMGAGLVNLTDGGDGVSGYRPTKPAHNKGVAMSPENKAHLSKVLKALGHIPPIGWNRGKKTDPEVIAKTRVSQLAVWVKAKEAGGRKTSDDTKAKQRAAKLGKKHTPEQNKAMSERMRADPRVKARGVTMTFKGHKHTAESRAKMSASMKGRVASNKGIPMPMHVKEALILAQKNRTNFTHSTETKDKIGFANKGRKASQETLEILRKCHMIPVQCIETGKIFESAMAASLWLGLNHKTQVTACCTGRLNHVRGFTFRHAKE